jgi:hypothetical protein
VLATSGDGVGFMEACEFINTGDRQLPHNSRLIKFNACHFDDRLLYRLPIPRQGADRKDLHRPGRIAVNHICRYLTSDQPSTII